MPAIPDGTLRCLAQVQQVITAHNSKSALPGARNDQHIFDSV